MTRRWRPLTALVAVLLTATGCGLRASHDEVVAAARLAAGQAQVAATGPQPSVTGAPTNSAAQEGTPEGGPAAGPATAVAPGGGSPGGAGEAGPSSATLVAGSPVTTATSRTGATGRGGSTSPVTGRSAPGRGTPAPAPAPAGQKAPIIIGSVGWLSGLAGTITKRMVESVSVWTQWINDRGGLDGHPVVHIVGDDGGEPARHQAIVQEFVEKRGVIAFVMNPEGVIGGSAADYPTKKRIPVVGTTGGEDYVYDSPMYFVPFPSGSTAGYSLAGGFAEMAVPQEKRKLGVISCVEVPALCEVIAAVWGSDRMRDHGFDVVYKVKASLVQPDFTSECLGARQAGADVIAIAMDANSASRIVASCHRQGYRPLFAVPSVAAANTMLEDPELDGAVVGSVLWPWPAQDTPARKEFHDVFARYRPGETPSGSNATGWVAAKAFETAMLKGGVPDQPTSAAVLEGLWSIAGNDLGGLTYPLPFVREQPTRKVACWSAVVIKDKAWTAPKGGDYKCAP